MTYGDSLDDEMFKERIGAIPLKQLLRNAKDRRRGTMGVAEVLVIEYNGKKKNPYTRLQLNKLYTKDAEPETAEDAEPDLFTLSDANEEE